MRPHVSTKEELLAIAEELETTYDAKINGALLRETAEVYEERNMFRVD
jgi:propanediol dehydratase small subunit